MLIKSTPTAAPGYVEAPDAESAIEKAIEAFDIKDETKQRRLVAQLRSGFLRSLASASESRSDPDAALSGSKMKAPALPGDTYCIRDR